MGTGTTNFTEQPVFRRKNEAYKKITKYRKLLTAELKSYNFSILQHKKPDILQSYFQKSGIATRVIWKAQKIGYQKNKNVSNPSL